MCGIAGTIGVSPDAASRALEGMRKLLGHRGPDDQGIEFVSAPGASCPVGLAHTRLAVVDLSAGGHQPMAGAGRRTWIVFNGEIYNHLDLRRELTERGAAFVSQSDTETILRAYEFWGTGAIERLRGMFAFCLIDSVQGTAWLCRDRMGQKPLYVARPSGGLLFASELRALRFGASDLVSDRVNPSAVVSFLSQGMVCGNSTIIDGIEMLPRATSLVVDFDGREIKRATYWSVPPPRNPETAVTAARSARWRSGPFPRVG